MRTITRIGASVLGSLLLTSAAIASHEPVHVRHTTMGGVFWGPRLTAVREGTLAANFEQCESTGRLANLRRAAGDETGSFEGYYFNDSDVYKAIEGAAILAMTSRTPEERAAALSRIEPLVDVIARAQWEDGYINAYFTLDDRREQRWLNTKDQHELYCIGHLIEAGVAHHDATGDERLLNIAQRAADHVDSRFGPPPKDPRVTGHPELELALMRLWRATGEERYRDLARHMIDARGVSLGGRELYGAYAQDHAPLADQREVAGHAVRAMYLLAGATDLVAAHHDPALREALLALWDDLTTKKMYVTGGIGNSAQNEGFTGPYDLPNESAYAESCATISLCMWARRMSHLTGDARYFDVFEQALFNGVLSGLSLDGRSFFYVNPLSSKGQHERQPWFGCACCPPNLLRFLAGIGGEAYAVAADGAIVVNLYGEGTIDLPDRGVRLAQRTHYPWDGKVVFRAAMTGDGAAPDLLLRIPSWSRAGRLKSEQGVVEINHVALEGGYLRVRGGCGMSEITLELDMPVDRLASNPAVRGNVGRVALRRGPIVYCIEDADNRDTVGGMAHRAILPPAAVLRTHFTRELLSGVVTLTTTGQVAGSSPETQSPLYTVCGSVEPAQLTFIPYFAWANREAGGMAVWIPETPSILPLGPRPGIEVSASHCFERDTPAAVIDRAVPANSADHSIDRFTWWPQRGTTEWIELRFSTPRLIEGLDLYWFDDGPPDSRGGCRLPAGVRIFGERANEARSSLSGSDYTWENLPAQRAEDIVRDAFQMISIEPALLRAVRIEVDLAKEYSAGLLEIRPR